MEKKYNVAIVGASGAVGEELLIVLENFKFPINNLLPLASANSVGVEVECQGRVFKIEELTEEVFNGRDIDIAFFSAGGGISEKYAKYAVEAGAVVIDNTSHFRMDERVPLVVPEVNPQDIELWEDTGIIANPNCSTIQMVMALAPLHRSYQLKRLVVSTYQSVTGSGVAAMRQMQDERICRPQPHMFYPHAIDMNLIPHGGDFLDDGYTSKEVKLVKETHKILDDHTIGITATVVRVPVRGGHSESINAEFHQDFMIDEATKKMADFPGITILDNVKQNIYPMPKYAEGKDDVFVGRIRKDHSQKNTLNMWIVSDNLRKGAATNAVQIAEYICKKFF